MKKLITLFLSITTFLTYSITVYGAAPDKSHHPLVSPYAGSKVYSKDVKQFDEYRIFKGWNKETKEYETQTLEGKVTKLLYKNPPDRSILEIYRNYEAALKKDGVNIIYSCNQANMECVDGYVGAHLRQQFGLSSIGNKDGRYFVAKLDRQDLTAYLIIGIGNLNTDIHVIEMKKMETGQVNLNMEVLNEEIDRQGFVVVQGIYFDTDKTNLKPESKPAIDEVAKLLKSRPNLKLFVVGHTDSQGDLAYNQNLSQGRAKAVVETLVGQHGIAKERLSGHGVGPLAPVASNAQETGRALNRRVVLVQK